MYITATAEKGLTKEMLATGTAMGFMYSLVDLGSVVFQGASNALGEIYIAAHTAARRIINILMQPMSGLMNASGTFVGQNWGAKQKQRIRDTLKKIMGMQIAWGLFSCLIVYLFGQAIIRFVTGTQSEEILDNAVMSLRIHFPFFPVLGVLLAMRVSMQSMGQKTAPVVSSVIELLMKINRTNVKPYQFHPVGDTTSPLTDEQHKANIRRGIQHCLRGDVFQIVISRRFVQRYEGDDFKLYRALRSINPSPYLFYFDFGGFRIFGSSPETHCRIEPTPNTQHPTPTFRAYIDPIAGTTKRTGDAEADRKGAEYLRNDPKENAEHVMLVDLARNDLSRNCHGVKVDFYKDLQYYSHVIHLVSRVSGELDNGADPIKAFIDTFPAGTLSGAPKVRAMQLISDYEPHNRGAYGGCIGYIGLDGSLNQAITIRTFVSRNGELWFQAGGGIVAKSDVEYELQEVNNKLGALRKAIIKAAEL